MSVVEKPAINWSIVFDRFLMFTDSEGREVKSSPIIKVDMIERKIFTQSGSIYNLVGDPDPRYSGDTESALAFYRTEKSKIILVEALEN